MTDTEKYVIVRLCAKVLVETELYQKDSETKALIDWIMLSDNYKSNNNRIREIMKDYCKLESECKEGMLKTPEQCKILCEERGKLYEKQQEIKHKM